MKQDRDEKHETCSYYLYVALANDRLPTIKKGD